MSPSERELIFVPNGPPKCCPICSCPHTSEITTRVVDGHLFRVLHCRNRGCLHGFLSPSPGRELLNTIYHETNQNEYCVDEETVRRNSEFFSHLFERYIPQVLPTPGILLDIGAGVGTFVWVAKKFGWVSAGVETNAQSVRWAVERFGVKLHQGDFYHLEEAFQRESFDLISMNHVFEHVDDPVGFLEYCAGFLKPGGCILLSVPNVLSDVLRRDGPSWWLLHIPGHISYFSHLSMDAVFLRKARLQHNHFEKVFESSFPGPGQIEGDGLTCIYRLAPGAQKTANRKISEASQVPAESPESRNGGDSGSQTALFVATSEPDVTTKLFSRACQDFPAARFTIVAPSYYRSLFPDTVSFISNEETKSQLWAVTRRLRRIRFDLTIVTLDGLPIFRGPKLWAFVTNYRNLWVYDANGDRMSFRASSVGFWSRLWKEIVATRNHRTDTVLDGAKWTSKARSPSSLGLDERYAKKVANERQHFSTLHAGSETLTEASNPALAYLLNRFQEKAKKQIGFGVWDYVIAEVNRRPGCAILSLGSGPCGTEINLAKHFSGSYRFDCMDINPDLLAKGKEKAQSLGLSFAFTCQDINLLTLPKHSYDIVFAHAALHHFVAFEHIFEQVKLALKPAGQFILYEVIPRNGMLMWSETNEVVQRLWKLLPDRLKYEHPGDPPQLQIERPDRDASVDGFECIRSQEIYPLLKKMFRTRIEVPGFVFARRFVDNDFGPNYDLSRPEDQALVDLILEIDQLYLEQELLKPESIFMVLD